MFVINPTSGRGQRQDKDGIIAQFSEEEGFEYKIYRTTGVDDASQINNRLDEFQPEMVIAVGGDGTINMVATRLIGRDIRLGIIPAGSANGLAYNLEVPENFEQALKINLRSNAKPLDVILINGEYHCLHFADIGLNARIVKRFEKEGSKGLLGYGKQLFKELFEGKTSFSVYIELPGRLKRRMKAEMLVIANAKSFGTGAIINPTGQLNDGKFEIIVIRPYPWWFVFTFLYASFSGQVHKMKYVKVFSSEKAKISLHKTQEFQIDGEVISDTKEISVEILHNAIILFAA